MSEDKMALFGKIKNIVGLKFTHADFYAMQRLLLQMNGRWIAFSGSDELFLPALTMGTVGAIGATQNVLPEVFVQIYQYFQAGKIREAMRLQQKITRAVSMLLAAGGIIKSCKAALRFRGLDGGYARPPYLEKLPRRNERELQKQWKRLLPEYSEGL